MCDTFALIKQKIYLIKRLLDRYGKTNGLTENMTETEMAKELGYDRIWDCGLIKYVWTKNHGE